MNIWKTGLLNSYYWATWPWRRVAMRSACRRRRAPLMSLFYHRIADHTPNDWTMSTRCFERQIHWLRRHFDLVSLAELQRRIQTAGSTRPSVAITFDDGYADNCDFALPLLLRHQIPCTYFVTLDNVLRGTPFPHDLALGQPLPPNSMEELRGLSAAGIEIGAHTRTHPDLGAVTDADLVYDEVVVATRELQQQLGRPIPYFAFPFGLPANLSELAFQLARDADLSGVCSAYGGYNFPGDDAFHLQRIHADPEMIRLKNWLTLDPRKRGITKRFAAPPLAAGERKLRSPGQHRAASQPTGQPPTGSDGPAAITSHEHPSG